MQIIQAKGAIKTILRAFLSEGRAIKEILVDSETGAKTFFVDGKILDSDCKKIVDKFADHGVLINDDKDDPYYKVISSSSEDSQDTILILKQMPLYESLNRSSPEFSSSKALSRATLISMFCFLAGTMIIYAQFRGLGLVQDMGDIFSAINIHILAFGTGLFFLFFIIAFVVGLALNLMVQKVYYEETRSKPYVCIAILGVQFVELFLYGLIFALALASTSVSVSPIFSWSLIGLVFLTSCAISILIFGNIKQVFSKEFFVRSILILVAKVIILVIYIGSMIYADQGFKSFDQNLVHLGVFFVIYSIAFSVLMVTTLLMSLSQKGQLKLKLFGKIFNTNYLAAISFAVWLIVLYTVSAFYFHDTSALNSMTLGDYPGHIIVDNSLRKAFSETIPDHQELSAREINNQVNDLINNGFDYDEKRNMIKPWVFLKTGNMLVFSCDQNGKYIFVMSTDPYQLKDLVARDLLKPSNSKECQRVDKILS